MELTAANSSRASRISSRIGVLGGTFDPVHNGHIGIATAVFNVLELTSVLFIPADRPWMKESSTGRSVSSIDHRIAMAFGVLGALGGHDVSVDDPGVAEVSFPGFWELLALVSGSDPVESWKDRR